MSELLDAARAWLDDDPDTATRAELSALLTKAESGDVAACDDIADRFAGPLEFGTAGLCGALGAGSNRMNRAVVIRAAAGLAEYLREHGGTSVVVGYDAATCRPRSPAIPVGDDRCGVAAAVLPQPLPTPVLAFAIRQLGRGRGRDGHFVAQPAAGHSYKEVSQQGE